MILCLVFFIFAMCQGLEAVIVWYIRFSEKCPSFTDTSFTTMYLYTNMKPNLSNIVIFILIEQNGS